MQDSHGQLRAHCDFYGSMTFVDMRQTDFKNAKLFLSCGKHPVTGQLVVVVHLALKRLPNITAPNNLTFELCA